MVSPASVAVVVVPKPMVGAPALFVVCSEDDLLMVVVALDAGDVTVLLPGSFPEDVALLVTPLVMPAPLFTSPCDRV